MKTMENVQSYQHSDPRLACNYYTHTVALDNPMNLALTFLTWGSINVC